MRIIKMTHNVPRFATLRESELSSFRQDNDFRHEVTNNRNEA
jgi:hypothetical protein